METMGTEGGAQLADEASIGRAVRAWGHGWRPIASSMSRATPSRRGERRRM